MKKMLALLLALMLALSCTLAMAESTEAAPAADTAAPVFNGLTVESEYDVDRAALTNLLTKMGLDESIVKILDAVAAIIDEGGEKLVVANDGAQCEVLLKGTSLINLVALVGETNLTIGSNLVPNYALSISFEEIGSMILSTLQEQSDIMNSLDLPALQEALTNYVNDYVNTCVSAIIPGEIQQGDFVQDGVKYNVMMPMKVDMPTIVDATNALVYNLQNDEAIQTALMQLALMGVKVNFEAGDDAYTIIDPAYLPSVAVEVYMNVDEQGAQNGPLQTSVFVIPAGETTPATTVYVKVNGNNVTVDAQFVSGKNNINLIYAMDRDPQDPFGVNARMDAYVNDFYVGAAAVTSSNDQTILFDAYLYVQDTENAIASEHGSITLEGALTLGVSDKATVLTLADLSGENAEDNLGGLGMDLLLNGLGGLLSTATELLPDEVGAITSLFMGGADQQPAA